MCAAAEKLRIKEGFSGQDNNTGEFFMLSAGLFSNACQIMDNYLLLSWPRIKSFFNAFSVFTANPYQALLKDTGFLATFIRPALC